MAEDKKGRMLRVPATPEDIKKSYEVISHFYSPWEGIFEEGVRKKGLELLSIKEGEVVLETGVGTGFSLKEIARLVGATGKAYGLDVSPQMLSLTEKRLRGAGLMDRVELNEGDARNMPYKNGMFDAVFMAATLELFDTPDIPRVLSEIKRVLKPEGRLSVASLSREGRERSWFVRIYEWLHRRLPRYASCRPIYVVQAIKDAGFDIVHSEEFMIMGMAPMKLVLARPG